MSKNSKRIDELVAERNAANIFSQQDRQVYFQKTSPACAPVSAEAIRIMPKSSRMFWNA